MKVSVFMTVKNGSEFIQRSIDSLINQTYLPNEIIIVDDGSTDTSLQKMKEIKMYSIVPIKIIETVGLGRARALNVAVENTKNDWIANLDVDDFWFPEKLKSQVLFLNSKKCAEVCTTSSYIMLEGEGGCCDDILINNNFVELSKKDFYSKNPINHSSILLRKDLFNKVGGYCESLSRQIDYDLWVRLILQVGVIYQVNSPLTVKYLHSKQSFESTDIIRYKLSALKISLKSLSKLSAPLYLYLRPFIILVVGFLPFGIKSFLKRFD